MSPTPHPTAPRRDQTGPDRGHRCGWRIGFAGQDRLSYTEFTPQRTGWMSLSQKPKAEVLPPRNAMALDTLAGVRGEMARLYRLALNGRIRSDEMTKFVFVLKEIRACVEAEMLTDVQRRLALLSRDMDNHNGQRVLHQPTFTGG